MAIPVKDATTLAKKFAGRAAAAAPEYGESIKGAGGRWQVNAGASEETWSAAVSEAAGRRAFSKGVNASGGAHYEERASTIGLRRYPEGVRAAEGAWAEGAQPYLQEIAATSLPPRGLRNDERNWARAREIGDRLHAKKLQLQGR